MCECLICKRKFVYGDKWSPMLKNNVWRDVVEHYGLVEEELEREKAFYEIYEIYGITKSERIVEILDEVLGLSIFHTYICYECMEKALGRKLTKEDLIGTDIPLNKDFEKEYFN